MIRFQNLTITGTAEELKAFIEDLTERLEGWQQDSRPEHGLVAKCIAIRTPSGGGLPDAMLYLSGSIEAGLYHMANIVPMGCDSLSREQYNAILQAFYDQCVRDRTALFGITAELTQADVRADDVLSWETVELLHLFSTLANKSTGSSHPADGKRWRDFISQSFRTDQILDSDSLSGLLMDEGWPEESAHELAAEYQSAIRVLRNYAGLEQ